MVSFTEAITRFSKNELTPTTTVEKSMKDMFPSQSIDEVALPFSADPTRLLEQGVAMTATKDEQHGRAFGFEGERARWDPPRLAVLSAAEARPGYNSMSASEYLDTEPVLLAKVRRMALLLSAAKRPVYYCGAGLSTSAGISDYASSKANSITTPAAPSLRDELQQALANKEANQTSYKSPLCAQPALAHRVLVALWRAGAVHRVVQQNHDGQFRAAGPQNLPSPLLHHGTRQRAHHSLIPFPPIAGLPQKAGMPQHVMNEIHGACHSPDNPVVPMSGSLRTDLFDDVSCARSRQASRAHA